MNALSVRNFTKRYPAFMLDSVTFTIGEGRICGLVGANGAGKSTLIKGIMGLIRTEGEAEIFGIPASEPRAKSLVGYAGGGFRTYARTRVQTLGKAVSGFYETWDERVFCRRLSTFGILPEKRVAELSEGMKVKLYLALALSHGARLLLLDEPTSGLDPLSREELCDAIYRLAKDEGVSVLFSTHISSDLSRIADDVVILSDGKMLASESVEGLLSSYRLARCAQREETLIGLKAGKGGFEGLAPKGYCKNGVVLSQPTLDDIIVHLEYERRKER